jgi:DNA-binding NarL/FixJ family response regulator
LLCATGWSRSTPKVDGSRTSTPRVRVLLADAHSLFLEALSSALAEQADLMVIGMARNGPQAIAVASRTEPQVAVIDADLPGGDGARVSRLIRERATACRILVLAAGEDPEALADAVEAGASGYITKAGPLTELVEAIRSVHRGDTVVPAPMLGSLLDRLLQRRRQQDEAARRISKLTPREREVLLMLAQGGDNGSIARALVISPQTARTHIQNLLVKLGVHSRLGAVAMAVQMGLLGAPASPAPSSP